VPRVTHRVQSGFIDYFSLSVELRLEFIQQNLLLIAIAITSGTMLAVMSFRRPAGRNALTPSQVTQLINREDAQVIDVREPDEYAAGHLPESRNFPLARLEERAGELGKLKDTPLILVCQSGARTSGACKQLEKLGFSKVHSLDGGINAWRTAGLPLKKGAKK
jgi:rhodanese-related sulfurtransferase